MENNPSTPYVQLDDTEQPTDISGSQNQHENTLNQNPNPQNAVAAGHTVAWGPNLPTENPEKNVPTTGSNVNPQPATGFTQVPQQPTVGYVQAPQQPAVGYIQAPQQPPVGSTYTPQQQPVGYVQAPQPPVGYVQAPQQTSVGYVQAPQQQPIGYVQAPQQQPVRYAQAPQQQPVGYVQAPQQPPVGYVQAPQQPPVGYVQAPQQPPVGYVQAPQQPMIAQPVIMPQTGQPILVHPNQIRQATNYSKFKGKRSIYLGVAQIVLGVLAMLMQIIGFDMQMKLRDLNQCCLSQGYYAFSGIWCGILFVINGGFAVSAGRKKTKCLVITTLVFAVVSLIFAMILVGFASWVVDFDSNGPYAIYDDYYPDYDYRRSTTKSPFYYEKLRKRDLYSEVSLAMGAIMLVCALLELMLSLWLMITCSQLLCPCKNSCSECCCCCVSTGGYGNQMVVFLNPAQNSQQGQYIQGTNPAMQTAFITAPAYYQTAQPASQVQGTQADNSAPPPYSTDTTTTTGVCQTST